MYIHFSSTIRFRFLMLPRLDITIVTIDFPGWVRSPSVLCTLFHKYIPRGRYEYSFSSILLGDQSKTFIFAVTSVFLLTRPSLFEHVGTA